MIKGMLIRVAFVLLLASSRALAREQSFAFHFNRERPEIFTMRMRTVLSMDVRAPAQTLSTRMQVEFRCDMVLTPVDNGNEGITTLRLETVGIQGEWDITGPAGRMIMALEDQDLTGTHDGVTIIDTAAGVGTEQATAFKQDMAPLFLTGTFALTERGEALSFDGEEAFVSFWRDTIGSQMGFFGIVFPERAVAQGDVWDATLPLQRIGDIRLLDEDVTAPVVFKREINIDERPRFSVRSHLREKDLRGVTVRNGKDVEAVIGTLERDLAGSFDMDATGRILNVAKTKMNAIMAMDIDSEGENLNIRTHMDIEMELIRRE